MRHPPTERGEYDQAVPGFNVHLVVLLNKTGTPELFDDGVEFGVVVGQAVRVAAGRSPGAVIARPDGPCGFP
jgi:hypothetical protein